MPRRAGELAIRVKSPHVYFILVARRFVYIGETQANPAQRWGEHLSSHGTLVTNVAEVDEELLLDTSTMYFFAYECPEVANVPQHERRLVTQFVEHQLHVKVVKDSELGSRLRIISDTSRTAPRRVRHQGLGFSLVDEVFSMFQKDASRVFSLAAEADL